MAGLFSAAVALAVGVLFDASIGGLWADALNLPLTAAGYLVPIAAGSAATAAGALARTGVLALAATAPDGRRRAVLLSWCAVVLWQVVSLGVLLVIAPVRLSAAGSLSAPMVLLPASALVLLLAATAVGTVIGTRWPSPVVAPILALAVFVPLYAFIYADGRAAAFAVIFPGTFYQPWFEPHVELVTAQIGLVGSVLLGAGAALLRGRRGAVVGAGAGVCACVALTALLTIEPNPVQLRRSHESACATREGVTLCVWPESRAALEPGLASLVDYVEAARPFLKVPLSYHQPGLETPAEGAIVELPWRARTPRDAAIYVSIAVRSAYQCGQPPANKASVNLAEWLVARKTGTTVDVSREVRRAVRARADEQQRWVDAQVAAVKKCQR